MRQGWRSRSTRQDPRATPAPDLVNRKFTAAAPNRLWVADATRIPFGEGVFWLAAVRDMFSAGSWAGRPPTVATPTWSSARWSTAIWSRDVRDGQSIHHSDRGSTYTSFRFAERLADNGILALDGLGQGTATTTP